MGQKEDLTQNMCKQDKARRLKRTQIRVNKRSELAREKENKERMNKAERS